MSSEWPVLELQEAGVTLIDCVHKTPSAAESGVPYVAIPQMKDGRIDATEARLVSETDVIEWNRKAEPQPWDVLLSRRCNPGETVFVPQDFPCVVGQNLVLLRANRTRVNPEFLRWLVRGPAWFEQVRRHLNVGAVFDSLRCADIPHFRLPIPSLSEQGAIAAILGALDDKIELDRRMSRTLDEVCRTRFSQVFVAEVDTRWRRSTVGAELRTVLGGTPSRANAEFWAGGDIPWISSAKARELRVVEPTERITRQAFDSSATKMMPTRTTIVAITGATLGEVSMLESAMCANQSVVGILPTESIPGEYVYYWVRHNLHELLAWQTGAAQQHISKAVVDKLPLVVPGASVMSDYVELARPIFDRIRSCLLESYTLEGLRDALLPRLLSGQLRVRDAEKVVEEVV